MPDVGLLTPGADLGPWSPAAVTDDVAVLRAMLRVEAAWVRVVVGHQGDHHVDAAGGVESAVRDDLDPAADSAGPSGAVASVRVADPDPEFDAVANIDVDTDTDADAKIDGGPDIDAVVERLAGADDDALALATQLARAGGAGGNPVIPLVAALREAVGPRLAPAVHAGLTSQDVLDTALVLVLRDAARAAVADLDRASAAAARLAAEHRARPALARTLAQAAVPTTLGARFAGWLQGILAARAFLDAVSDALPLSYGGAAGELSGLAALSGATELYGAAEPPGAAEPSAATERSGVTGPPGPSEPADDPGTSRPEFALVEAWGAELGLPVGPAPWHATRTPVVRIASALAETCTALGKVANDVLQAVRPGVGELREPPAQGRGTSSAMAHKRNPVLSVLVRRSAIVAPHLAAQVLGAAGLAVDERSDGAWHAEWPALQMLARHAIASAHAAAELLEGLEVDTDAVARNLRGGLSDGMSGTGPAPDVAAAAAVVGRVLDQYAEQTGQGA